MWKWGNNEIQKKWVIKIHRKINGYINGQTTKNKEGSLGTKIDLSKKKSDFLKEITKEHYTYTTLFKNYPKTTRLLQK